MRLMSFLERVSALLVSILVIVMVFGCGVSADSADSAGSARSAGSETATAVQRSSSEVSLESGSNGIYGEPGREASNEPTEAAAAKADQEALGVQVQPGEAVTDAPGDQGFGSAREIDDPFAVIGPAFSGLGFQSYSSGCDPFEDKYGTCL